MICDLANDACLRTGSIGGRFLNLMDYASIAVRANKAIHDDVAKRSEYCEKDEELHGVLSFAVELYHLTFTVT